MVPSEMVRARAGTQRNPRHVHCQLQDLSEGGVCLLNVHKDVIQIQEQLILLLHNYLQIASTAQ